MKKLLAILLLILGGAAVITLITLVTSVFFLILASMLPAEGGWALYTVAAMFLLIASYPFKFLREYFKIKFNVNAAVFTVCFCAPSLIAAETANLLYTPAETDDLLISVDVVLIFWLVITAVFTLWMIVHAVVENLNKLRLNRK